MDMAVARAANPVRQPAGGRDYAHREDQPWAGIQAFLDCHLEAGVQPARFSHASVARGQGLSQHVGCPQMLQGLGFAKAPAAGQVIALGRQMIVAIDEARHQRHARNVDYLNVGREGHGRPRTHILDFLAVQQYRGVGDHRPSGPVNQSCSQ